MNKPTHFEYFKRVLFTEKSMVQRIFNKTALVVGIAEGIYGWYLMLK